MPTFADFWAIYPRKISCADAEKAFRRILWTTDLWLLVWDAIERQRKSEQWQQDGGRFIPYPGTWLRGERWRDELPAAAGEVETCGWPGCTKQAIDPHGTRKYCSKHKAALMRGESP